MNPIRTIHQTWKRKYIPPEIFRKEWQDSWRELNPGWQYRLWTDDEIICFVESEFPEFFPAWCAYPEAIMRVDVWRYLMLKRLGGLYVDLDFACLQPLDEWLPLGDEVVCGDAGDGLVCNALIWAPRAGHPFFDDVIPQLRRRSTQPSVIQATGPGFLTDYARERRESLICLDRDLIYPISWQERTTCAFQGAFRREELAKLHPKAKAITFWAASWVDSLNHRIERRPDTPGRAAILFGVIPEGERGLAAWSEEGLVDSSRFRYSGALEFRPGSIPAEDIGQGSLYSSMAGRGPATDLQLTLRKFLQHEFDWLFICSDLTYVCGSRFPPSSFLEADLVLDAGASSRGLASERAGYALRRELVEVLAKSDALHQIGTPRYLLPHAALQHGARLAFAPELREDRTGMFEAGAEVATTFPCDASMRAALASFTAGEPSRSIQVTHPHWSDRIDLYRNGVFRRIATGCAGNYEENLDGSLLLRWFEWDSEIVRPAPGGAGYLAGSAITDPRAPALSNLGQGRGPVLDVLIGEDLSRQLYAWLYGLQLASESESELRLFHQGTDSPALAALGVEVFGSSNRGSPGEVAAGNQAPTFLEGDFWCGKVLNSRFVTVVAAAIRKRLANRLDGETGSTACHSIGALAPAESDMVESSLKIAARLNPGNPPYRYFLAQDGSSPGNLDPSDMNITLVPDEASLFVKLAEANVLVSVGDDLSLLAAALGNVQKLICPRVDPSAFTLAEFLPETIAFPSLGTLSLNRSSRSPKRLDPFLANLGIPVTNPAYWSRVDQGLEKIAGSRIVICGLARDLGDAILTFIRQTEVVGGAFRDYRVVIFENDSRDATREALENWARVNPRIVLLSEALGRPRWPSCRFPERVVQLAEYRNYCLDEIRLRFPDFDAVMVMDTDLVGGISLNGVANTFGSPNWDFMGAKGIYSEPGKRGWVHYDSWAFRKRGEWKAPGAWFDYWVPPVGDEPVPVNSCFGGCGIYRMDAILSSYYDSFDCEHVCLHHSMIEKGFDRLFLNPGLVAIHS